VTVTINPPAASAPADPCAAAEAHWKAADAIGTVAAYEDHVAKFPSCAFANLARTKIDQLKPKTALASPSDAPAPAAAKTKDFDGKWDVQVKCTDASGALGYGRYLTGSVTNGTLHAEEPNPARPPLAIDGDIGPDGKATLVAHGLTSNPNYTVGHVNQGTPYSYSVDAKFEKTRGTGKRMELRPYELTFAKK
jgi:hypothetical protein